MTYSQHFIVRKVGVKLFIISDNLFLLSFDHCIKIIQFFRSFSKVNFLRFCYERLGGTPLVRQPLHNSACGLVPPPTTTQHVTHCIEDMKRASNIVTIGIK